MKVLFLTSWYPTDERPHFGLFVREHARAIQSAGHDVRIISVQLTRTKDLLKITHDNYQDEFGLNISLVSINSLLHDFLFYFFPLHNHLYLKTTHQFNYEGWNPDIIHANVVYPAGVAAKKISEKCHIPYIITEHWSRVGDMLKPPVIGGLIQKTYAEAAKITVVSEFLKNNIISLIPTLQEEKFSVIGNVVDTNTFQFSNEHNTKSNKLHFCAVATWNSKKEPDKLPELFIEALAKIKGSLTSPFKLTMIGGGDQVVKLKDLCDSYEIEAEFTRFINKAEIAAILQQTDYLLHASRIETFSIVVAEALSCGVPVVCSNVGALPELVNSSNGVLCENTVQNWIEAINSAVSMNFDRPGIADSFQNKFSKINIGKLFSETYKEISTRNKNR